MINRGGATLMVRIADQTGASAASIAAAFAAVRQSYDMIALNGEIDALDNIVSGDDCSLSLYAAVQDLLLDRIVWFIRNVDCAKAWTRSSRIIATASRRSKPRSTASLSEAARKARARAHGRADEVRRAGGVGAPHRRSAGA